MSFLPPYHFIVDNDADAMNTAVTKILVCHLVFSGSRCVVTMTPLRFDAELPHQSFPECTMRGTAVVDMHVESSHA